MVFEEQASYSGLYHAREFKERRERGIAAAAALNRIFSSFFRDIRIPLLLP